MNLADVELAAKDAAGRRKGFEDLSWKGTWIEARWVRESRSGKTHVWEILNDGLLLGEVRWYAQWRKYAFYPDVGTLYEAVCLRDLATFCDRQTTRHREAAK